MKGRSDPAAGPLSGTAPPGQSVNWTTTSWRMFVYDGANVALELDLLDGDRIVRSFFHGAGEVLAVDQADQNGETVWGFADLSGSIRSYGVVDGSGDWQFLRRDFDEWGVGQCVSVKKVGRIGWSV